MPHDLKRDPAVLLDKPYHSLLFYLPREALNAIADDASAPRIGDLNYKPGAGINDVTISRLGCTILPALSRPEQANRLFIDHVTLAVGAHVAQTYGEMRPVSRPVRGGLAPWQVRRAKEVLSANLDGGVPLKEVARECRLSVSHFSRAFRRTDGRSAAPLAAGAAHRASQGAAAQYRIVVVGCGLSLRLCRSKSPDSRIHPHGRRQSGRLAPGTRWTTSRRSAGQPITGSLAAHLFVELSYRA